jgi:hypothetical protein
MPTVLRVAGLRVAVYPNDHSPAHVHVLADDREAVFQLNCPKGPPTLRQNYRFGKQELAKARAVVEANRALLCRKWSEIHGRE